jgi:hypothetical protein
MAWHVEEAKKKKKISPEGFEVVFSKFHKWFGIIVPTEIRDISRAYEIRVDKEIPVIGFLVDPLGRIFYKATDIDFCYSFIEDGEIDNFFSSTESGGCSFCTLTTVKAAYCETYLMRRHTKEVPYDQIRAFLNWLVRFDNKLDRSQYPRSKMFRIGMTCDGENAHHLILDPSEPVLRKIEERVVIKETKRIRLI